MLVRKDEAQEVTSVWDVMKKAAKGKLFDMPEGRKEQIKSILDNPMPTKNEKQLIFDLVNVK